MAYSTKRAGQFAEEIARKYLEKRGCKFLTKNFHCRFGEIDLIMQNDDGMIFVEVRSKSSSKFGLPEETITYTKQQKIIRTALFYLQTKNCLNDFAVRFDVIGIVNRVGHWDVNWIPNAFYCSEST